MQKFSTTGVLQSDSMQPADAQCHRFLRKRVMERIDAIAKQRDWKLHGQPALYMYFAEKYHWLPSQVRSLSTEEIAALLEGEPQ